MYRIQKSMHGMVIVYTSRIDFFFIPSSDMPAKDVIDVRWPPNEIHSLNIKI